MRRQLIAGALIIMGVLSLSSCRKDDNHGNIIIRMTDAPAAYQQVNVEILKIRVQMSNGSWTDLPTNSGIYNLLTLQNGIDTTIVSATKIPIGDITQMRLVLGTRNTVMIGNVVHDLDVPSGTETGIKLVSHVVIPGNATINVLLDFDAAESVIDEGSGTYHLKPVVKVQP